MTGRQFPGPLQSSERRGNLETQFRELKALVSSFTKQVGERRKALEGNTLPESRWMLLRVIKRKWAKVDRTIRGGGKDLPCCAAEGQRRNVVSLDNLSQNPITMSIGGWGQSPSSYKPNSPLYIVLGVDAIGADPYGTVKVNFKMLPPKPSPRPAGTFSPAPTPPGPEEYLGRGKVVTVDYTQLKPLDVIERATGYRDTTLRLDWMARLPENSRWGTVWLVQLLDHICILNLPLCIQRINGGSTACST